MSVMTAPKRPRSYFEADEELKAAISLETVRRGFKSESDFIASVLRDAVQNAAAEAKRIVQQRRKREEGSKD